MTLCSYPHPPSHQKIWWGPGSIITEAERRGSLRLGDPPGPGYRAWPDSEGPQSSSDCSSGALVIRGQQNNRKPGDSDTQP
eukprot:755955-Hanusia_phi.AAC.1